MKITKLTATFGTLQNASLELRDGLNILELPNEAGKSTWTAFLFAMLYGVDTAERSAKGSLPVKTKYKPWSGAPMTGRMELIWQGRPIVIERGPAGRVPMGDFRAYDAETGEPVRELRADNCGEVLMGAEKGVCLRSAIIRQAGLSVSQDAALEKRLVALASTGEEQVSYSETQKRLQDWKNRCRHNQTGRIPALQRQIEQTEAAQRAIRAIHMENLQLTQRQEALIRDKAVLETAAQARQALAARHALAEKEAAGAAFIEAKNHLSAARQRLQKLPEEETLEKMAREAERLQEALREAAEQTVPEPEAVDVPEVFRDLPADALVPKARRDAQQAQEGLSRKKRPAALGFVLGAVFLILGVLFALGAEPYVSQDFLYAGLCGGAALGGLLLGILGIFANARAFLERAAAEELLSRYDARSPEDMEEAAQRCREKLLLHEQAMSSYRRQCQTAQNRTAELEKLQQRMLGSISVFAGPCETLSEGREAISQALALYVQAGQRRLEAQTAEARLEAVTRSLGDVRLLPVPEGNWEGYDFEAAAARLEQTDAALRELQTQLDMARGRQEALGNGAELAARREELLQELSARQEEYAALELAQEALRAGNEELQQRVSPQVCQRAGALFSRLTGGRYDQVVLDHELNALAREVGSESSRQLPSLSAGTADQLYLALRLALCELILDESAPIVLDDALVMFDDVRMKTALEVLMQEEAERQILLFTCQSREKTALQALQNAREPATI